MPNQAENQEESQAEKELSARPEGTLSERSGERTLNSPLDPQGRFRSETEKELSTLNSQLSTSPPSPREGYGGGSPLVLIVEDDAD